MSDSTLQSTKVSLDPRFFSEKKRPFLESGALRASLFLYDSGVAAVQLENGVSELVMLPFQGQQIWSATFGGRNVTMKSMFDQPRPTSDYLQTYGGFLLHCGFTAMGVPTDEDDHPLHGELPNAVFQQAWLVSGEDEGGAYIGLGGRYQHTVAFADNYTATPLVKLYAGAKRCTFRFAAATARKRRWTTCIWLTPISNRLMGGASYTAPRLRRRRYASVAAYPATSAPAPNTWTFSTGWARGRKNIMSSTKV